MAVTNNLSMVCGYGGTGKSSIIHMITRMCDSMDRIVYVAALAGKAKERVKQIINRETFTIHRLITELKKSKSILVNKRSNPIVVIDEATMVDICLMHNLIRAFTGLPFSLLLVGDSAQLPPIGFGVFWHQLVLSKKLPKINLTDVKRQSEKSAIHLTAMNVRANKTHEIPEWSGQSTGDILS